VNLKEKSFPQEIPTSPIGLYTLIEENKIKFKFDTTLITQDETVVCVLYLDNERENNDFYRFSFKVKISEIDLNSNTKQASIEVEEK